MSANGFGTTIMRDIFSKRSRTLNVQPEGRDAVIYSEGDHKMTVITEMCIGEIQRAVLAGSIKRWQPPHEGESVSGEKKRQILKAVVEYWQSLGKKVAVEDRKPWCERDEYKE